MDIFDQISAVIRLNRGIEDFEVISDIEHSSHVKIVGSLLKITMYWTCSALPYSNALDNITSLLKLEFGGTYAVNHRFYNDKIVQTVLEFELDYVKKMLDQPFNKTGSIVYDEEYANSVIDSMIDEMSNYVLPSQVTWRIMAIRWLQEDNMSAVKYASQLGLPVSIVKVACREWEKIVDSVTKPKLRPFLKH